MTGPAGVREVAGGSHALAASPALSRAPRPFSQLNVTVWV